ncbi:MAG: hypothetical protein A2X84_08870 [Desulfuromonadaceae bacterium GWC2_58_13]|nr:MAG: hypothetical protein A2X84_08870 [Desulfuromonadaceae bacterium GWC2_58_13]
MAGVSAGILWLSLTSSPPVFDDALLGWDKAQHALAYGVLALVAGRFFSLGKLTSSQAWGLAVVYAMGYGGLLEVLQAVAGTGRMGEWGDLVADAVGALSVGSIGFWLRTRGKP